MVCVYGRAKEQCNDHIDASCLHILNIPCSSLKEAFWIFWMASNQYSLVITASILFCVRQIGNTARRIE